MWRPVRVYRKRTFPWNVLVRCWADPVQFFRTDASPNLLYIVARYENHFEPPRIYWQNLPIVHAPHVLRGCTHLTSWFICKFPHQAVKDIPLLCPALLCPPRRARAASSLGCALPNPQPPSRSWATIGPAHLPVLKPQQPDAQSASLVQGPVMNCFPAPFPAPLLSVDTWGATVGVVAEVVAAVVDGVSPRRARAASSLGCESPNPQPPSRSWATIGPAHLPVLKPQQPEAQSASLVHGPVMNCVPRPTTSKATSKQ
jgi:hypothetical protein